MLGVLKYWMYKLSVIFFVMSHTSFLKNFKLEVCTHFMLGTSFYINTKLLKYLRDKAVNKALNFSSLSDITQKYLCY